MRGGLFAAVGGLGLFGQLDVLFAHGAVAHEDGAFDVLLGLGLARGGRISWGGAGLSRSCGCAGLVGEVAARTAVEEVPAEEAVQPAAVQPGPAGREVFEGALEEVVVLVSRAHLEEAVESRARCVSPLELFEVVPSPAAAVARSGWLRAGPGLLLLRAGLVRLSALGALEAEVAVVPELRERGAPSCLGRRGLGTLG